MLLLKDINAFRPVSLGKTHGLICCVSDLENLDLEVHCESVDVQ